MHTVKEIMENHKLMHNKRGFIAEADFVKINARPINYEGVGFYSLTPEGHYIRAKIPTTSRIMLIKQS